MSSNRTAPSSSRGIDGSCRSNLIMALDTAKQSSRNLSGLTSIHVLSRRGIEMEDSVTVSRGLALATGLPVTLWFLTFFGYVLVNSIHNSNPRNCSVSKQIFDQYRNVLDESKMLLHFEVTCTLDIDSSFHRVFRNLQTGVAAQFG